MSLAIWKSLAGPEGFGVFEIATASDPTRTFLSGLKVGAGTARAVPSDYHLFQKI